MSNNRRIPRHVINRNRNAVEAERNAQFYASTAEPTKRCACGHTDDDHYFGGRCDRCECQHVERATGKCIVDDCQVHGPIEELYFVCSEHLEFRGAKAKIETVQ